MLMPDVGVFFVILAALAVGYFVGKRASRAIALEAQPSLPWTKTRYLEGLTYLLKEQADEAIDRFISDMEVNAETLEVHLSLGGLLRRKGEIARAVKVHQNLLSRPSLGVEQQRLVQLELAKDYMHSGLLDRAESLLVEIIDLKYVTKEVRHEALVLLIDVYQDTKEWLKAIDIADRLTTRKFTTQTDTWREAQAHYCCELSLEARQQKNWFEMRKWIRTALKYDKNCVRASLLQAQCDMEDKKFPAAIAALKRIPNQNPELASEMIQLLYECYQSLGSLPQLVEELESYLAEHKDIGALKLWFDLLAEEKGIKVTLEQTRGSLDQYPNMEPLMALAEVLHSEFSEEESEKFASVAAELFSRQSHYECRKCGFSGEKVHWLCPSCKQWGEMRLG